MKPPAILGLFGHSGFKSIVVVVLLMDCGAALLSRSKTPPGSSTPHRADRSRISLANLRVALEIYRDDTGAYPSTEEGLAALVVAPEGAAGWKGPYIFELKHDLWSTPFHYRNENGVLVLAGCGPDRLPDTPDDIVVEEAMIDLDQPEGRVEAVVVFRDGTRRTIRDNVGPGRPVEARLDPHP